MLRSGYLENEVLSADPIGLVRLLYDGAIESLLQARAFFNQGRIRERSSAINKTMLIVLELQSSLDGERGGEIARNLAQLYAYVQERLTEANGQQKPQALEEALKVMSTLHEGWKCASLHVLPRPAEPALVASPTGWTL